MKLRVRDCYRQARAPGLSLTRKKAVRIACPPTIRLRYIEQYLAVADIAAQRDLPIFRRLGSGRGGALTDRGLDRREIYAMVRRRTAAVGLPVEIGCHSLRGSGITNYLKIGGTIEVAARLAEHSSTRTTQLYDRRSKEVEQG